MQKNRWFVVLLVLLGNSYIYSNSRVLKKEERKYSAVKALIGTLFALKGMDLTWKSLNSLGSIFAKPVNLGVTLAYGYAMLDSSIYTLKHTQQTITGKENISSNNQDNTTSHSILDNTVDNASSYSFFKGLLATYIISTATFRNINNLSHGTNVDQELNGAFQPYLWYSIYKLYPTAKNFLEDVIE